MLYALFFTGCVCLLFGAVYPAVMAVYWMLFRRGKERFMDFMRDI